MNEIFKSLSSISSQDAPFQNVFKERGKYEIVVFCTQNLAQSDENIQSLCQSIFSGLSDRKFLYLRGGFEGWKKFIRSKGLPENLWVQIGALLGCVRADSVTSPNDALMKTLSTKIPVQVSPLVLTSCNL